MSYTTYQCQNRSTSPRSPCRRCDYGENCISKEKDILISQLKAHIFELELREKDFNMLKELITAKNNKEALDKWIADKQKEMFIHIDSEYKHCDFKYPGWIK